jgi:Ca-activated chloride channel family protein
VPASWASAAKAQRFYKSGEYQKALSEYQELLARKPDDQRLHYNAGTAAYRANKFDQALKEFQVSASSSDIDLQQQSFYNLGNAEYRLGESSPNTQERIALWEQAVQHYEAALRIRPTDKEAEFNRDLVRKKLEELKQQQQENQEKQKDENNEEKQDKDEQSQENQENSQNQDQKNEKTQNQESNQQQPKDQQKQQQRSEKDEPQQNEDQEKQSQEQKSNDAQPQNAGDNKQSDQNNPQAEGSGEAAQLGRMTPTQARQLLDAQKGEEKALIFIPQGRESGSQNRTLKDW